MSANGTIITVAPTGAETAKNDHSALPVTLDELVQCGQQCQNVGASIIHVHLRNKDTEPTLDLGYAREVVDALRENTDLVVQLSTGGSVHDGESERLKILDAAPDMASCTMGTVNFGTDVFHNRWDFIVQLHEHMRESSIMPEYEIFDLGQLSSLERLLDKHGLPYNNHVHIDLVLGVPGGAAGDAATVINCVEAARRYLPEGTTFSATGIGRTTMPVMLASLACGGNLRVGMEDTLNFSRGQKVRDNTQLVGRAAALATMAGRPPASTQESRTILSL